LDSPCVFWLTGQAGSGKSTIAYTVADHFDDGEKDDIEKDANSDLHNVLGANFFCSRQFQETRLQKNILPTIVYQLARRSRSYAHALLRANKFDSVDVLTKQMRDLLVDPWQQSSSERPSEIPPYLVVVDALDEIEGEGGSAFLRDLLKTIDKGHL
jgi:ABC-type dipeptide/oligopeptide/nickel transport system ATPase component